MQKSNALSIAQQSLHYSQCKTEGMEAPRAAGREGRCSQARVPEDHPEGQGPGRRRVHRRTDTAPAILQEYQSLRPPSLIPAGPSLPQLESGSHQPWEGDCGAVPLASPGHLPAPSPAAQASQPPKFGARRGGPGDGGSHSGYAHTPSLIPVSP